MASQAITSVIARASITTTSPMSPEAIPGATRSRRPELGASQPGQSGRPPSSLRRTPSRRECDDVARAPPPCSQEIGDQAWPRCAQDARELACAEFRDRSWAKPSNRSHVTCSRSPENRRLRWLARHHQREKSECDPAVIDDDIDGGRFAPVTEAGALTCMYACAIW